METIDVKQEVEKAVGVEWAALARRHPHLAAALDQQWLVAEAMTDLADDPEYRAAMERAAAIGGVAQSLEGVVRRFVANFVRELTGK